MAKAKSQQTGPMRYDKVRSVTAPPPLQPRQSRHTAILGLVAETPLHPGDGRGDGAIDLPVQREKPTAWPTVRGQGVKGSLRELAMQRHAVKPKSPELLKLERVFGPEQSHAADFGGALAVGDATILLLPIRSLTSNFCWVTCHEALQRYVRACERMGISTTGVQLPKPHAPQKGQLQAIGFSGDTGSIYLEEFEFAMLDSKADTRYAELLKHLKGVVGSGRANWVDERLLVVGDSEFRWFAERALAQAAHIALDRETKTVQDGALWYEETLPCESVLYCTLEGFTGRDPSQAQSAHDTLAYCTKLFDSRPYLRVGGNETVGMGWCKVNLILGGAV